MKEILLGLSLSAIICSCNQTHKKSYRDVVLERYLAMMDTSGKYDTTDQTYMALKAYLKNDTTFLKRLDSFVTSKTKERENWDLWTADIPLSQLNQLKADEAYRFMFSVYGAPSYEAITILKKDSLLSLQYLFYAHDKDSFKFEKIRAFEKSISKAQWDDLTTKIRQADFWGLKNDKDYRGRDGNDLTVFGYIKSGNYERNHFVHRWGNTTLNDAFYFVYYDLLNKGERVFGNE